MVYSAQNEFPTVEHSAPVTRTRGDLLLTVGAGLGTLCVVAAVLALSLGLRPMIFETGSMAPTIPTGSLGLSRTVPAASVHEGDVVSVVRQDGVRVTHRVESVSEPTGNSVPLRLRGDANDTTDRQPYVVTEVQRIVGTVPLLGYVAVWLKNPYTLALQALGVALLLGIAFAPDRGWRNSPTGQRVLASTAAATVVVMGVTSVHGTGEAQAATTATATGTVSAGRPPNPGWFRCQDWTILLVSSVRLSWPNPPSNAAYKYELRFERNGKSSTRTLDPNTTGYEDGEPIQTWWIDSNLISDLLALLTGSGPITVTLSVVKGNFKSAVSLSHQVNPYLLIGLNCVSNSKVYPPEGAAARLATPESTTTESSETTETKPSESAEPDESSISKSAEPDESTPASKSAQEDKSTDDSSAPTSTKMDLPSGGKLSDAGDYAYYKSGGEVTIRSAETGEPEYEGRFSSSSDIRWLPETSTLEITEPDGTVTLVKKVGSRWTETVQVAETTEKQRSAKNVEPSESTPEATEEAKDTEEVPTAEEPGES